VIWLRSALFNLAFFAWSALYSVLFAPALLLPRRASVFAQYCWAWTTIWLARAVAGIDHRAEGLEHLPDGPAIVAARHESAYETFAIYTHLDDPAFVMKRELLFIPLYGWHGLRTGQIGVDRSAGASAMRRMLKAARQVVADGRSIIIFPEGTRKPPEAPVELQPGIIGLYKTLGVPVVPVAVNSGRHWPRRSFLKRPGVIVLRFMPAIPPGLPRREFMDRLTRDLENESRKLANGDAK